ncbi:MAG: Pathogenicity locus [Armatimonadetes bacterium]|nr:Pathogenicity locus [Armatimonadota bacterium]
MKAFDPERLSSLPGVGKSIEADLIALGYRRPADLVGQDPEEMYERIQAMSGAKIDRCLLYVFRCAVYVASTPEPEERLTKWWNWMDAKA